MEKATTSNINKIGQKMKSFTNLWLLVLTSHIRTTISITPHTPEPLRIINSETILTTNYFFSLLFNVLFSSLDDYKISYSKMKGIVDRNLMEIIGLDDIQAKLSAFFSKNLIKMLVPKWYSLDMLSVPCFRYARQINVCLFVVAWKDIKFIICWTRRWLR